MVFGRSSHTWYSDYHFIWITQSTSTYVVHRLLLHTHYAGLFFCICARIYGTAAILASYTCSCYVLKSVKSNTFRGSNCPQNLLKKLVGYKQKSLNHSLCNACQKKLYMYVLFQHLSTLLDPLFESALLRRTQLGSRCSVFFNSLTNWPIKGTYDHIHIYDPNSNISLYCGSVYR